MFAVCLLFKQQKTFSMFAQHDIKTRGVWRIRASYANTRRLACSKRSDSGERCEVKKVIKNRGGLGREVRDSPLPLPCFFFSHSFLLLTAPHYLNAWNRLIRDEVKGLQNCQEFSHPSSVYIRLCYRTDQKRNSHLSRSLAHKVQNIISYCFS